MNTLVLFVVVSLFFMLSGGSMAGLVYYALIKSFEDQDEPDDE